jgi:hypothetical protein
MFCQSAAKVSALSQVPDYFLKMSLEQQDIQELEQVYRQVFFFSKFKSIWNDNIKMDFIGKRYERVKWIQLAQWKALVNTIITYWLSEIAG